VVLEELKNETEAEMGVIALASTQIKASKQWMTKLRGLRLSGKGGESFVPPTYASIWNLKTIPQHNEKGNWFGVEASFVRYVTEKERIQYEYARTLSEDVLKGTATIDETGMSDTDDEY
jgi:hypothetical protein